MPDFGQAVMMDAARRTASMGQPTPRQPEAPKEDSPGLTYDEREPFLEVRVLKSQFFDYQDSKTDEIEEQKRSRHYYHGAQYTGDQLRALRRRRQPPLTWNRVNRKINGIVGLAERQRSDPKCLPNHQRSEQGADVATQSITYVLKASDFKNTEPSCLLQAGIDGITGVQMVLTQDDQQQTDLSLIEVVGDEFFYDPKSYKRDFSDARYMGVTKWLDLDEAVELFPDKEDKIRSMVQSGEDMTTYSDREYKWVITSTQKLRLVEHWYKHRGKWRWCFYVGPTPLAQGVSPFFDDRGRTICSFQMMTVHVDHDGDRYGFVRNLFGPQDSLNQSKSKSLHLANSRRVVADKGAVDDVEKARIEIVRPDGYVEKNKGMELKVDDSTKDVVAFQGMAESAAQEIDSFAGINTAILTGASLANISGRALDILKEPGMAELGPFLLGVKKWKLQIYRNVWAAVQRHWTQQKWIRVSEDDQKPVFLELNGLTMDQWGRPTIVNALGSIDVDITLDEGPDVATMTQDAFELLSRMPPGAVPPAVIIELSPLPSAQKKRILQQMKPPPNPLQIAALKTQLEAAALKNVKTAADARYSDARAEKARAEAGATGDQADQDSALMQHTMWKDLVEIAALAQQVMNPQQGGMPGQPQGAPGLPGMIPGAAPRPMRPHPANVIPHPAMGGMGG